MSDLVEQAANFLLQHMEPELCNAVVAQADEIERLKAKLTQDPKDARCQLYKATQEWQQEAERCNAEIEQLEEKLEKQKRLTKTALRVPFMRSTPKGWEYIPEDDDE